MNKKFRLPTKVSFKGGSPPNLCKPSYPNLSFFLAFPNLGTRFLLRVVVCNIPDFWKVQKSQKFETFCFHVMQVTKKPNEMQETKENNTYSNEIGIKNPIMPLFFKLYTLFKISIFLFEVIIFSLANPIK